MLIQCPECKKPVSEAAPACPGCGFTFNPAVIAAQKETNRKAEQSAGVFTMFFLGAVVVLFLMCSGVFSPKPSSSDDSSSPSSTINKPVAKSDYATDQARLLKTCGDIEEGKSSDLSSDFHEAGILAARQNVRRGEMSKEVYEKFTGEKFPE